MSGQYRLRDLERWLQQSGRLSLISKPKLDGSCPIDSALFPDIADHMNPTVFDLRERLLSQFKDYQFEFVRDERRLRNSEKLFDQFPTGTSAKKLKQTFSQKIALLEKTIAGVSSFEDLDALLRYFEHVARSCASDSELDQVAGVIHESNPYQDLNPTLFKDQIDKILRLERARLVKSFS